jgi:hypothetical protein
MDSRSNMDLDNTLSPFMRTRGPVKYEINDFISPIPKNHIKVNNQGLANKRTIKD